eukprot:NODE_9494_length_316_cov_139.569288_g7726_i0.p4 GENE.NODE_9494_length_316_cov_139.569288_g7726_i0~~NODE_9494_length_316_cov_139.569288_g7726_i0.p4  ORF type:complete len:59 (+),score=4.22 NODE_9494_length_316_cov_139.569288_g7726_i0:84-260(+)
MGSRWSQSKSPAVTAGSLAFPFRAAFREGVPFHALTTVSFKETMGRLCQFTTLLCNRC